MEYNENLSRREITEETVVTRGQLSDALSCPICFYIKGGPMFLCERGHTLCYECSLRVRYCPLCGTEITKIRSLAIEFLISTLKKPCRYKNEGCKEVFVELELKDHEEICEYREVLCNETDGGTCKNVAVPYSSYIEHLTSCHNMLKSPKPIGNKIVLTQSLSLSDVGVSGNWPTLYFLGDGKIFFLKFGLTDEVYWYVAVMASPEVAKKYQAYITITKTRKGESKTEKSKLAVISFREAKKGHISSTIEDIIYNTDSKEEMFSWKLQLFISNM